MESAHRILVRGTNWIGDSVMSVAALRELRRLYPESHITLLARPWVTGLFESQGLVDEILSFPESSTKLQTALFLRRTGRRFDQAILFQNAFGAALSATLARIPKRFGYDTDHRGFLLTRRAIPRIKRLERHQVYYYLDLLHQTGVSPTNYVEDPSFEPSIELNVPPTGKAKAVQLLRESGVELSKPCVVINPGAYFGPAKRWFTDRYAQLADHLIQFKNSEILIVGSADERRIAEEITDQMKNSAHVLSGATDLASLMGILSICDLFITNDSGPMHLAAALNASQIALFGSTDEIATGPYSVAARVIHKHVECSPCLLRECPIDLRCFSRISVEEVAATATSILESSPARPQEGVHP